MKKFRYTTEDMKKFITRLRRPTTLRRIMSAFLIVAMVFIAGYAVGGRNSTETSAMLNRAQMGKTISIMLDAGPGNDISVISDIEIKKNESLGEVLLRLDWEGQLALEATDYRGDMGLFVNSINNIGGDDSGAWWQFWVNNRYSQVGVSNYVVQPGDVIYFRYDANSFE